MGEREMGEREREMARRETEREYYSEVDKRREMDGRIVRREIVSVGSEGGDLQDAEKRVVVEVE